MSLDPITPWKHSLEQVIDAFWAVCFFIFKTTELEYYVNASIVTRKSDMCTDGYKAHGKRKNARDVEVGSQCLCFSE